MEHVRNAIAFAIETKYWQDWEVALDAAKAAYCSAPSKSKRLEAASLMRMAEDGLTRASTPAALMYSAFNRPGHTEIIRGVANAQ